MKLHIFCHELSYVQHPIAKASSKGYPPAVFYFLWKLLLGTIFLGFGFRLSIVFAICH